MKNFLMIAILILGLGFMGCTRDDDTIEEEEYIYDSEEEEEEDEERHIEHPADIVEDLIF